MNPLGVAILACVLVMIEAQIDEGVNMRPNHRVLFRSSNRRLLAGESRYNLVFSVPKPVPFTLDIPDCRGNDTGRRPEGKSYRKWCNILDDVWDEFTTLAGSMANINASIEAILSDPIPLDSENRARRVPMVLLDDPDHHTFGIATQGDLRKIVAKTNKIILHATEREQFVDTELDLFHASVDTIHKSLDTIQQEVTI